MATRSSVLALLALCDVLAMATWFSPTAVLGSIAAWFGIAPENRGWITAAVQIGFVMGALLSATTALADSIESRTLIRWGALIAAASNAGVPFVHSAGALLALRFITGFGLALVYPPSVKLLSSWFVRERGLAIGAIIGALTIGSFAPHLLNNGRMPWQWVIYGASLLALFAVPVVSFVPPPIAAAASLRFDPRAVFRVMRAPGVALADAGYWGHMWELYAVWSWAPLFYAASLREVHASVPAGATIFLVFGVIGALGCLSAGAIADRIGRANVAAAAMIVSGTISFSVGWLYGANPVLLTVVFAVWGFSVIADSAQFSAAITELCDSAYVGTALTLQMGVGFLITMVTIWLLGVTQASFGWRYAFTLLALGPAWGAVAMIVLKRRYPRRV